MNRGDNVKLTDGRTGITGFKYSPRFVCPTPAGATGEVTTARASPAVDSLA